MTAVSLPYLPLELSVPENVEEIGEAAFGYNAMMGEKGAYIIAVKKDACLIEGYTGSTTEKYALDNGIAFKALDDKSKEKENVTKEEIITKEKQIITAESKTVTYNSKSFSLGAKTSGDRKLTYSRSNKKVATISSVGKVTIKGYGKATITIKASSTTRYEEASKKITIEVVPKTIKLSKTTSTGKRKLTV